MLSTVRYPIFTVVAFSLMQSAAFADCSAPNQIDLQHFFQAANVQYENVSQRAEISSALRQLADSPQSIRLARFRDYGGRPNQWSFTEIMDHYFVPALSTFLKSVDEASTVEFVIEAAQCQEGRQAILGRIDTLPIP